MRNSTSKQINYIFKQTELMANKNKQNTNCSFTKQSTIALYKETIIIDRTFKSTSPKIQSFLKNTRTPSQSKWYNLIERKNKKTLQNHSTICTTKRIARDESDMRSKILMPNNRNISHPMKNLCNILKSKKIRKQNIPSINHPYIQNNNKNIIPSISITSIFRVLNNK